MHGIREIGPGIVGAAWAASARRVAWGGVGAQLNEWRRPDDERRPTALTGGRETSRSPSTPIAPTSDTALTSSEALVGGALVAIIVAPIAAVLVIVAVIVAVVCCCCKKKKAVAPAGTA